MDMVALIKKNHEKLKHLGEDNMKVVTQGFLDAWYKIQKSR